MAGKKYQATFSADRPIPGEKSDKLGRAKFASALADRIRSWRGRDSLVVALCGEWGCGKTSLKNMVVERLGKSRSSKVDVLEFNPWQVSGHDTLSAAFFHELLVAVGKGEPDSELSERRAKRLRQYADLAGLGSGAMKALALGLRLFGDNMEEPSVMIEGGAKTLGSAKETVALAAKAHAARAAAANQSLGELKKSLSDDMAKLERPLLVVIDDIDRLTSAEIREVFQLVKANGDFPNITYLLMFDRGIVAGALDSVSGNRGDNFLEKIVQVLFHVPQPSLSHVHAVLSKGLDECLAQEGVSDRWSTRRWTDIWFYGMKSYFSNLRSVYRFLSSLEFQVSQMKNGQAFELNPVDLVALETLRLFEPALYETLPANRALLVGGEMARPYAQEKDKLPQFEADKIRLLAPASEERRDSAHSILRKLFPVFFGGAQPHDHGMQRELRVGCSEFFDRYFTLSLQSDDVPEAQIDRLRKTIDKPPEFKKVCETLLRGGQLGVAFDRLDAYNNDLPRAAFPVIITSLADVADILPHIDWYKAQRTDPLKIAWRLIYVTLREIEDENERFELLRDGLSASTGTRLAVYAASRQERFEGRSAWEYLVSEEQCESLKTLALERLRSAAENGTLRELPDLDYILWRWSEWAAGTGEVKTWVAAQLQTSNDAIWFLRRVTSGMTSGSKIIRYIIPSTVERFAEASTLESLTAAIDPRKLDEDDRRALRAFRYAIKWKKDGKPDDYRGEGEPNGNPLAEDS